MAELLIEKKTLNYVNKYFDNNYFQIISEDITHYVITYNEEMCIPPSEILADVGHRPEGNQYLSRLKIASRNLKKMKGVLKENKIGSQDSNNLLFMILYIQVGIYYFPDWVKWNQVHKSNICNLIIAKIIAKENIQDISIAIKSKKNQAIFDNLNWSLPILELIIEIINDSLQLSKYNEELNAIINDESITVSKLKLISDGYLKETNPDPKEFLTIVGMCVLVNYLNDKGLLKRENVKLIGKKQLKLISDIFQINGLIQLQTDDDVTHLKNLGQKIRDTLKKHSYKIADFAPSSDKRF